MSIVAAVEVNALPCNEASSFRIGRSSPRGGESQRVMIKDCPLVAFGNSAGTGIQPDGNPFVGEIFPVTADLEGINHRRPIVHIRPRGVFDGFGAQSVTFGQAGEVRIGNGRVLRRVCLANVRLTDVVHDVILLPRNHPRLRNHQTESVSQRFVHRVRIAAASKFPFGKSKRRRQRTGLLQITVTVNTKPVVDLFSTFGSVVIERFDQPSVIDSFFVLRQFECDQSGWRL